MAAIDSMRVPNDLSLDKRAIIFYIARKEISIFISTQQKIAPYIKRMRTEPCTIRYLLLNDLMFQTRSFMCIAKYALQKTDM